MLVVLGIIALVSALSLPMIVPIMRTRTVNAAVDTVKSACILARSTAIQQRKMMNLTFLQQTDSTHGAGVVLTGYDFAGVVTAPTNTTTIASFNATDNTTFADSNQTWTANCFANCQILIFLPNYPNPAPAVPAIGTIQSNTTNTITFKGTAWSGSAQYYPNNMVSVPDSSSPNGYDNYVCTAANSNQQPPGANWQPLSLNNWNANAGNVYVVMSAISPTQPYCIHYPGNYSYSIGNLLPDDIRFLVLKTFSQYMGQTVQYLPTGCQFDFTAGYNVVSAWSSSQQYVPGNAVTDGGNFYKCIKPNTSSEPPNNNWGAFVFGDIVADKGVLYECIQTNNTEPPNPTYWSVCAWTYVFLPNGEVWTLLPPAQDVRDPNWLVTTYMSNGSPSGQSNTTNTTTGIASGPKIWGPQNLTSATIVVYATTGEVVSE